MGKTLGKPSPRAGEGVQDRNRGPKVQKIGHRAERLIEVFQALSWDADRKVFLVLDSLGVHHCKPVKAWLADHAERIEVFYLPSYSPELNPDERLNAELKHVIGSKVPARTQAKLRAVTDEHMTQLEQQPGRVPTYFRDTRIKYAA